MAQHTPGPWTTKAGDGWRNIVPRDGHGFLAKVRMRRSKAGNLTEMEANANLIAEAPELLRLVRRALDLRTVKGWSAAERTVSWEVWEAEARLVIEAAAA
jgi:hypothetical protein